MVGGGGAGEGVKEKRKKERKIANLLFQSLLAFLSSVFSTANLPRTVSSVALRRLTTLSASTPTGSSCTVDCLPVRGLYTTQCGVHPSVHPFFS